MSDRKSKMAALGAGIRSGIEAVRRDEHPDAGDPTSRARDRKILDIYHRSVDFENKPVDKAASRFITGRHMAEADGALAATVKNLGYEGVKKLSMALGLDYVLGGGGGQGMKIDETTSPASWSNALATQAGIMSDFFYPEELPGKKSDDDGFEEGTLGSAMTGRNERESKLAALYGDKYGAVVISEMGGPKKDRKKELNKQIEKRLGSYEEGSLKEEVPAYARSLSQESSQRSIPAWAHRKLMNSLPTLAGLGLGLSRGATFGPGPGDSIVAEYPDESGMVDPQTLGEVMLLPEGRTGDVVPTHELGHVAQGKYFGPFLPAASAGAAGALALAGKDPYLDSPFETSALEMGQAEEAGEPTSPAMFEAMRRALSRE